MKIAAFGLPRRTTLRSLVVPAFLLATTGTSMGYFALEWARGFAMETQTAADAPAPVHERRDWVVSQLLVAGITPESLAAAGVPGSAVGAIVDAACEYCERHGQSLAMALQATAAANSQASQTTQVTTGLDGRDGRDGSPRSIEQAAASAATATQTLRMQRDAFIAAAIQPLGEDARITLQRIATRKHWDLPVEFKTLDLTEAQRIELRDALTASRQHQASGTELDPSIARLLAARRSSASTAKANHDANLAAVRAAWVQELEQ